MSRLRERCAAWICKLEVDGVNPTVEPDVIEDLYAFVMSEIGRAADERFDDSEPLVLYFTTPADRQELLDAIRAEKPGMLSKVWP